MFPCFKQPWKKKQSLFGLIPWIGSEALKNAMAEESCGCRKIIESEGCADYEEEKIMKDVGEEQAKKWNCPLICKSIPEPDPNLLTENQIKAFKAIKKLTKLPVIQEDPESGSCDVVFETCPMYYYDMKTQSGKDAKRVEVASDWKSKGQFDVVEEPARVMVQAVDIYEQSRQFAIAHENENITKKKQKEMENFYESQRKR